MGGITVKTDEKASLAGNLDFISLADIFQILGGNGSTGVLTITSPYSPNPGLIYFKNGDSIDATTGQSRGLDALYALFGWTEGRFEFRRQEVQTGRVIKNGRMEILLDALRMLDDGDIKRLGPPLAEEEGAAKEGKERGLPVVKGPLVDYAHVVGEEGYTEGQRIVREGGHGRWIWVILNGTAEVSRESPNGPVAISRLAEGCFIGIFRTLTFREEVRTASVTALTDVQLGLLDTERLSVEYASLEPDFKNLLLSLDNRQRKITNRILEYHLKKDSMKGIAKDKKVVIKKGTPKEELFRIQEGEVYLIGETRKGLLPLLTLEKEDVFGYIPFFNVGHEPHSASVLASDNLKTEKLDIGAMQRQYEGLSGTLKNMIYGMAASVFVSTQRVYQVFEGK